MQCDTQLLAHAGAPSNRKDDDRAKVQLQAYMAVRSIPTKRVCFTGATSYAEDTGAQRNDALVTETSVDPTLFLDDTQLAYTALESQLLTSSPTQSRLESSHADMRSAVHSVQALGTESAVQAREHPPPSNSDESNPTTNEPIGLSQCSYLVSPFVNRTTMRRRLDPSRAIAAKVPLDDQTKSKPAARLHYSNIANHLFLAENATGEDPGERSSISLDTTSELPTSYSLSQGRSESSGARSKNDVGSPSNAAASRNKQQTLDFMTSKAPATVGRDFATPTKPVFSGSQIVHAAHSPLSASTVAALRTLSIMIDPPEPDPGIGSFRTHVTMALERLAQNHDIAKSYRPLSITREVRSLERGYWVVDCSSWPIQKQVDFWKYLETSIQSGKLGWGIRCTRGTGHYMAIQTGSGGMSAESAPNAARIKNDQGTYQFGPVKVYCWGEVIKHVYLLLYIASVGQVRKLGLQWLDADRRVVVQMHTKA